MDQPIYHRPDEYDLEHADSRRDIAFYIGLARDWHPQSIVELGCGDGRVTIPLAAVLADESVRITGLDQSPDMIESARRKSAQSPCPAVRQIEWLVGDLRTWRSPAQVDLLLSPCGTFTHLPTIEDQLAAWTMAWANLLTGGRFVLDVPMAEFGVLAESMQIPPRAVVEIDSDTIGEQAEGSRRLLRYKATQYDAVEQRALVRFLYDKFGEDTHQERFLSDYSAHVYYPR